MNIANYIQSLDADIAKKQHERALLEKLPGNLGVGVTFSLNGVTHLHLTDPLEVLLATLPPCNAVMTLRDGSWVAKPENKPLDWTQRTLALVQSKSGVQWNHYLDDGTLLCLHRNGASLPKIEGYRLAHSAHHVVLQREVVHDSACKVSSVEHYDNQWHAFMAAEGYTALQRLFANAFKALASRNVTTTFEMLPLRADTQMSLGNEVLEIRRAGSAPSETLPAGSVLHGLVRIGAFWQSFTEEQARKLQNFANGMACDLEALSNTAAKNGLNEAIEAVAQFQRKHLVRVANLPTEDVLRHWVEKETGFPVSLSFRNQRRELDGRITREVHLSLWKWHESTTLSTPELFDPAGFDFQNPSTFEYAPNPGKF